MKSRIIFPENFEAKIGFDTIRMLLKAECHSDMGKGLVDLMEFTSDPELITHQLDQADEFRSLLLSGDPFPAQDYHNMIPDLHHLEIEGAHLDADRLPELRSSLEAIIGCIRYLTKPSSKVYPNLRALTEDIYVNPQILKDLNRIIDDKGNIRDSASPGLLRIRQMIREKQSANERMIERLLTEAKQSGWVTGDTEITIREGRLLIPVPAANKRKIRGFIHDESATGQTVYIEPAVNFDLNNEIRELENAERREIYKILLAFSDSLRPEIYSLTRAYYFLGTLDFIRAKAAFALKTRSMKPHIGEGTGIAWERAFHPLLFLNFEARKKKIVPFDIVVNDQKRIVIISGPNAGGKSVCLKAVGLIQYMMQCGMLVPLGDGSTMGLFRNIFLEIGDEQSIDNDLSTYSSHLVHLKYILEEADKESLFLIDEFGAGTDPMAGGVIAEAVLEKLAGSGSLGVVTTHYSNLKQLALKHETIQNAAMLFDVNKMQPLFQLSIGRPGSSFAFEIAHNIGLPRDILETAKSKTDQRVLNYEKLVQDLENEKTELERQREGFKIADDFLKETIARYNQLKSDLETQRKKILSDAIKRAEELLGESNRKIENTIREIREHKADKEKVKDARQELKNFSEELQSQKVEFKLITPSTDIPIEQDIQFKAGDWVRIKDQDVTGQLVSLSGGTALIDVNGIHFKTSSSNLVQGEKQVWSTPRHSPPPSAYFNINQRMADFRLSIDLRGKSVEEALSILRKYLDDALLLSASEVSILHGKGDGILRQAIREYLQKIEEVESFEDEHIERGGTGITRVRLR